MEEMDTKCLDNLQNKKYGCDLPLHMSSVQNYRAHSIPG
jgi:hypothetical protein